MQSKNKTLLPACFGSLGRRACVVILALVALSSATQLALAGTIPYPNVGVENSLTYTFTATASGDIIGYFAGSTAAYEETVGMSVNGGAVSTFGLDDHTTAIGTSFDFGTVNAGDTLVFVLDVFGHSPPYIYSDSSLNAPYDGTSTGHNHIYSTSATAGQISGLIPAGTYVAFEDLPATGSDWNYFDDTFVFTDVSTTTRGVPDGGMTVSMLGLACAGLGLLRRKIVS